MSLHNSHSNPVASKIRKKLNKNNEPSDQMNQSKENIHNMNYNCMHQKGALRQISINVSSANQGPVRTLSKLINTQTNSVLNKSYSLSQLALQRESAKCTQHLQKLNDGLRLKISQTEQKIKNLSKKKEEMQNKYNKLVEHQSSRMKLTVSKLQLSNIQRPLNISQNNEWSSILQISCDNPQQSKAQQSTVKLSQIKQRICDLDMSSLVKFARNKVCHKISAGYKQ